MRLLNAHTQIITEFSGLIPPYAILSHTWGEDEVGYDDFVEGRGPAKRGYRKIQGCCKKALADGLEFVWIDTCCIDKRSSSELSEAINSMFNWYRDAAICYAYLEDVQSDETERFHSLFHSYPASFPKSRWFSRGWTLQELLAPPFVVFYAADWVEIGTRSGLRETIATVTHIDRDFFISGNLSDYSIAQKMSWASRRQTTRLEDQAYCLLGIFSVSMPLLYGEGRRAFLRLQEEIMRVSDDQSIFAWDSSEMDENTPERGAVTQLGPRSTLQDHIGGLLAPSPSWFYNSSSVVRCETDPGGAPYSLTNQGIKISLPYIDASRHYSIPFVPYGGQKFSQACGVGLAFTPSGSVAVLNCQLAGDRSARLALFVDHTQYTEIMMRTDHSLGLISIPNRVINDAAERKSLLIKAYGASFEDPMSPGGRKGRLVLIQPFGPPLSSFTFKKLSHDVPFHPQENGGLSLRVSNDVAWHNKNIRLLFTDPRGFAFALVIEALGTPGRENSINVRCQVNLSQEDGEVSGDWRNSSNPADESSEFTQTTPDGDMKVKLKKREADHASIIAVISQACWTKKTAKHIVKPNAGYSDNDLSQMHTMLDDKLTPQTTVGGDTLQRAEMTLQRLIQSGS